MYILGLSGSPSPRAWSAQLLAAAVGYARDRGHDVDVIDLRTLGLPMVDIDWYESAEPHPLPSARRLTSAIAAADAVIVATSVHHSSYSGLLKNALDYLHEDALERRPVGLLANAGNQRGATIACEHLRSVIKAMGGWATPTQVATSRKDFDPETRQLAAPALHRHIGILLDELELLVAGVLATRGVTT